MPLAVRLREDVMVLQLLQPDVLAATPVASAAEREQARREPELRLNVAPAVAAGAEPGLQ
jgi:hypothetical protein